MRREQGQSRCIDHMTRLMVERAVDAECIAVLRESRQVLHAGCSCDFILYTRNVGIVPAHVEAEALRSRGGRLSNTAKAEQAQGAFLQPQDRGKAGRIPPCSWRSCGGRGSA